MSGRSPVGAGAKVPSTAIITVPAASAPISGGRRRPIAGSALSARNTAIIGAAIQKSSRTAKTRSSPKRRNTPATIAITIGIGRTFIARATQPAQPSTSISAPVA